MKIFVLLPIYNEAARLERLLEELREALARYSYSIVAVNDGSEDTSAEILDRWSRQNPVSVVTHARNLGLGQTLMDGLRWVTEHSTDEDVLVTMDADDTHDPAYIAPMLEKLAHGYDVVIASRFQPGASVQGVPRHRRLLSYGVLLVLRFLMPIPGVRDYACGYRVIRTHLLRKAMRECGEDLLQLRDWGFICTAELLWRLHAFGARCAEVPFRLRYDLKESTSRMRIGRTIAGYGLLIFRSRTGRMAPAGQRDRNSRA